MKKNQKIKSVAMLLFAQGLAHDQVKPRAVIFLPLLSHMARASAKIYYAPAIALSNSFTCSLLKLCG
ncbi:hypothetical protein [Mucilaginibacter sp. HD30]